MTVLILIKSSLKVYHYSGFFTPPNHLTIKNAMTTSEEIKFKALIILPEILSVLAKFQQNPLR